MRRLFRGRLFSTEGTAEKVITKESKGKDGSSILERINIVHRWNKMGKVTKFALLGYGLCASGSFFLSTYNDGRSELIKRRIERRDLKKIQYAEIEGDPEKRAADDWEYVRRGCTDHIELNFWSALFFPFKWVTDATPRLILLMNPEKDPPKPIDPPKPPPMKWMKDPSDENASSQKN